MNATAAPAASTDLRRRWHRTRNELVVDAVVVGVVLAVLVIGLTTDRFVTVANAKAIVTSASLVGIAALGLTLIMIGGSAVSLAISPTVAAVGMVFLSAQSLGLVPALVLAIAFGAPSRASRVLSSAMPPRTRWS